ncbi:MAG: ribosome small subunit-dependent GTPase A [Flavobacteriales bacterium]|nr:ribosome small subunit-dependent GTPase A [Flavobacteriales bacterium]
MTLEDLGYNAELVQYRLDHQLEQFEVGRIFSEHKERYGIRTANQELDGEIIGNLRYTAHTRSDFPTVGDWVALVPYDDDKALIHAIYPRKSILERQAVGKKGEKQPIASNIDTALLVQAVDRDFSINRLERYLTICHASGIEAVVILNKIDLIDEQTLKTYVEQVQHRMKDIPVFAISNNTKQGIGRLKSIFELGKTYCLLGSSGVGKSTLINTLVGKELMKTDAIGEHSNRGKHITSHRELHLLDSGGILIDNPGMREVGIADSTGGLEMTFDDIYTWSKHCRFSDCSHVNESGCAVRAAVESGELDQASYENYLKMERERTHFEMTVAEKRKKEKVFGKLMKNYKKSNYKKDQ